MNENSITFRVALFLSCLFPLPLCAWAQTLAPQEIVKRADDLLRGETSQGLYQMTVATASWTRTLKLEAVSQGRNKTFIRIIAPAKEAGITTLRIDNNMWNYLPKIERTIKIPPSMMLQPWMGSDYSNDDLVKESSIVHDYTHTIIAEEPDDAEKIYTIQLDPKPNAAVAWGKLLLWIRASDFVPLREEFYDEHGKLIKILEYAAIRRMSDRVIPTLWTMKSMVKKGSSTTIEILEITYNQPVDENIFSLAYLKR